MRFLLDTHVWINRLLTPEVIPARIHGLIRGEKCGLCTISYLETAVLHRRGKLTIQSSLDEFFAAAASEDIEVVELTAQIAAATNTLPADFQGDPFDRTIAATARVLNLTLITADKEIRGSEACAVEFYPFRATRGRR